MIFKFAVIVVIPLILSKFKWRHLLCIMLIPLRLHLVIATDRLSGQLFNVLSWHYPQFDLNDVLINFNNFNNH